MDPTATTATFRKAVIEAFAMGVAAVVGKACWNRLEFDVIRRNQQQDIGAAVALHKSQVSRQRRCGTIEFHRLIYVLTTFGKTLGDLPNEFPVRRALKLSGIRFLAYRQPWVSLQKMPKYEAILDTFTLMDFFIANEIAKEFSQWVTLSEPFGSAQGKSLLHAPPSERLANALRELEEKAHHERDDYVDIVKRAFGSRYEDVELRHSEQSLQPSGLRRLLEWAEAIRQADSELQRWLRNPQTADHAIWAAS